MNARQAHDMAYENPYWDIGSTTFPRNSCQEAHKATKFGVNSDDPACLRSCLVIRSILYVR